VSDDEKPGGRGFVSATPFHCSRFVTVGTEGKTKSCNVDR
jgi:hypothetical protein